MITITVANQKGGVGKTTTAVTLAHGLALLSQAVTLVDLDSQGQCATALGLGAEAGVFRWLVGAADIHNVTVEAREGLTLVPGNRDTAAAQILWGAQNKPVDELARLMRGWKNWTDYVVIDTSPSVGGLQERALYAADIVLTPVACDFLAADAVAATMETMRQNQQWGWKGTNLILPTFFDETTRESRAVLDELRRVYEQRVLEPIHRATGLRECAAAGVTVWEAAPTGRAGREYSRVVHLIREL